MLPPDWRLRTAGHHSRESLPHRPGHGRKRWLLRSPASRQTRFDRGQLWHCSATPSDRFRPSSGRFLSFRQCDVRLAHIDRLEGWQRKAAPSLFRKSRKQEGRRITNRYPFELRKRFRSKNRNLGIDRGEFCFQFVLGEKV